MSVYKSKTKTTLHGSARAKERGVSETYTSARRYGLNLDEIKPNTPLYYFMLSRTLKRDKKVKIYNGNVYIFFKRSDRCITCYPLKEEYLEDYERNYKHKEEEKRMATRYELGNQTEKKACEMLAKDGWWCHRFKRSENGSQPCDIVALRGKASMLLDGKHCNHPYLPTQRIEGNQINCFKMASEKGVKCGFVCEYMNQLFFVDFAKIDFAKSYVKLERLFQDELNSIK